MPSDDTHGIISAGIEGVGFVAVLVDEPLEPKIGSMRPP